MDRIKEYLETTGLPEGVARRRLAEFERNPDIAEEFAEWIQEGVDTYRDGIAVEGYTAKQIKELAPFMNGVGVYNFLVDLRERPDIAKGYIAEGFPIR